MRKVTLDIETANFFPDTGSTDPASLSIAVVCIHDSETNSYASFFEPELGKLWPILEQTDLLIGYNSDHFDIPLLNKYYPGDLSRIKSVDLMKEIKKTLGRRLKLDAVARATLGGGKSGSGYLSSMWWRQGEKDKVVAYCLDDVKLTKALFEHALEHGFLKYPDGKAAKEVRLDTSDWQRKRETVLTHTLPF